MKIKSIIATLTKAEKRLRAAKVDLQKARESVGREIHKARNCNRLTQKAVAEHLGISIAGYFFIENGRAAFKPEHLLKLDKLFSDSK